MEHSQKSEKRTHKVIVRFSASELAELQTKTTAAKKQRAVFIREACLSREVAPGKTINLPRAFLFELNKIGVNLNQIARSCNSGNIQSVGLLAQLAYIRDSINNLLQALYLNDDS